LIHIFALITDETDIGLMMSNCLNEHLVPKLYNRYYIC